MDKKCPKVECFYYEMDIFECLCIDEGTLVFCKELFIRKVGIYKPKEVKDYEEKS